jgi:2-polyprenyl-6-methoxyphenol hydroxylase-like FAD-dependent oxidoreductase
MDRNVIVEAMDKGWLFSTLDSAGSRVISFFTDHDQWATTELRQPQGILRRQLSESHMLAVYAGRQINGLVKIASAGSLALDRAQSENVWAIGDAAQTWDPLSSQGILDSIADAEHAATMIARLFETDLPRAVDIHEYDRRRRLAEYLTQRRLYYRGEMRWPNHPFWRCRHGDGDGDAWQALAQAQSAASLR